MAQLHLCPGQDYTTSVRVSGSKREMCSRSPKRCSPPSPCDMFSRALIQRQYKPSVRLGTPIRKSSKCTVWFHSGKLAPEFVGVYSEQGRKGLVPAAIVLGLIGTVCTCFWVKWNSCTFFCPVCPSRVVYLLLAQRPNYIPLFGEFRLFFCCADFPAFVHNIRRMVALHHPQQPRP